MGRVLPAIAAAIALTALAFPSPAAASRNLETIFMDSADVIGGDDAKAAATIAGLREMGVTRLRIAIWWHKLAPDADSLTRPSFDATDPAQYPADRWRPYDRAIRLARQSGLKVYVNITGFAPRWATPRRHVGRLDYIHKISPEEWRRFVRAVGRRYSGRHRAEDGTGLLPKVDTWSLYNEPNQGGWLSPQWEHNRLLGKRIPYSPIQYRQMLHAGWSALRASGHSRSTLLLGELAPSGVNRRGRQSAIRPMLFMRELLCLDSRYRPFKGREARARKCTKFRKLPGKIFAHHPYGLALAPGQRPPHRDDVTLAVMGRLGHVLDRGARFGRVRKRMQIWSTEFGWQTRPNPYTGISTQRHAEYLMRAEYLHWRHPRVHTFAQYLLRDEPKRPPAPGLTDRQRWGSWQSGLLFHGGRPKPALRAFEMPVQAVPPRRRGRKLAIWGAVRPPNGGPRRIRLEHKPARGGGYRAVGPSFRVAGRGYFLRRVNHSAGRWRFAWLDAPDGKRRSRSVTVRSLPAKLKGPSRRLDPVRVIVRQQKRRR